MTLTLVEDQIVSILLTVKVVFKNLYVAGVMTE